MRTTRQRCRERNTSGGVTRRFTTESSGRDMMIYTHAALSLQVSHTFWRFSGRRGLVTPSRALRSIVCVGTANAIID
jgi:hypothetical protein